MLSAKYVAGLFIAFLIFFFSLTFGMEIAGGNKDAGTKFPPFCKQTELAIHSQVIRKAGNMRIKKWAKSASGMGCFSHQFRYAAFD